MGNVLPSETIRAALQRAAARVARQHRLVLELGQTAFMSRDLESLLDEACRAAAEGLEVGFSKVLKYLPGENSFLLIAGVGWSPDEIGTTRLDADNGSPAGYAPTHGRPVMSNHLREELRFRTPDVLLRHGITRALNVPIRATPVVFGVIEADSALSDDFIESDVVFLEGLANVLALAIERLAAEAADRDVDSDAIATSVLNASSDCIKIMSPDGLLQTINRSGICQMEIDDVNAFRGKTWSALWPEEARPLIEKAVKAAATGEASRFEAFCPTAKGTPCWWDISVSPVAGAGKKVERIVAVSRNITDRHANEARLEQVVAEQELVIDSNELMVREVHHRVRNSLQLVQMLLTLQASLAQETSARDQLQAAALRVNTIGTLHRQLYEFDSKQGQDARVYLSNLLNALAQSASGRSVELHADAIVLPNSRLSPLGLITTELVLNAIKYGSGNVTVSLRALKDAIELAVEDEGHGFPDNFPAPQGTGLGMRLVKTYSGFGASAIRVDRSVPWSRIIVKFKND